MSRHHTIREADNFSVVMTTRSFYVVEQKEGPEIVARFPFRESTKPLALRRALLSFEAIVALERGESS